MRGQIADGAAPRVAQRPAARTRELARLLRKFVEGPAADHNLRTLGFEVLNLVARGMRGHDHEGRQAEQPAQDERLARRLLGR